MKRCIIHFVVSMFIVTSALGGDSKDALRGGLVGAAFGALVNELDHASDPGVTIPVFAGLGALAGYARDKDWDRHHRERCWRRNRFNRSYRYNHYAWRGPYAWYPRIAYTTRQRTPAVASRIGSSTSARAPKPRNLHPGVSLLSVPITLPNGMPVEITLFNLNGKYVGPKGEHYDSLPSPEMLSKRYAQYVSDSQK